MPHTFDVLADAPVTVQQIHAAFGREDYWHDRLAGDAATTLDSLDVDDQGSIAVRITQHLGRQVLPAMVARAVPADLKLRYCETWRPVGDGSVRGTAEVSSSGGLGSSRAENLLAPTGNAARLRSAVRVEVKIPLMGRQLEKMIASSLSNSIPEVLRFTTTWIDTHG